MSCLDLFGDNFSPAPQRAWKLPLWKKFLRISTNRFKTLILFLSLRLFNWFSNICKRECSVRIFFSETTVYYENGSRGGKILWCSFLMGKDLSCNVIKTNSTCLMLPPTIEARAPVNGVGRGTSWVQDEAPGRRVITESVISLVNAWRFFLTCTIPPTTT